MLSGFLPFSREEFTSILYKVNGIRVCNWQRGANWTCEELSGTRAQDRGLRSLFQGYIDLGDDRVAGSDRYAEVRFVTAVTAGGSVRFMPAV